MIKRKYVSELAVFLTPTVRLQSQLCPSSQSGPGNAIPGSAGRVPAPQHEAARVYVRAQIEVPDPGAVAATIRGSVLLATSSKLLTPAPGRDGARKREIALRAEIIRERVDLSMEGKANIECRGQSEKTAPKREKETKVVTVATGGNVSPT